MKIFCVGIGGIGLSGVAQILKAQGNEVFGSDRSESEITMVLQKCGISISDHSERNINDSFDQLIYSEAVPENNPERMKAKKLKIPEISYAKALGNLSRDKKTIAITGTHGKTTTTGMITSILLEAKKDPSVIIGSKLDLLKNQNFRIGLSDLFLCEACEYRDNFLHLSPFIVLINTLEPDHLDYFKNEKNYYASFQKLIEKVPKDGTILLYECDKKNLDLSKISAPLIILPDTPSEIFTLNIPGKQNQHNAASAKAIAKVLGISDDIIRKGLKNFHGAWRRFEYKGEINGAKIYDDYGHHPTEIRATLQAASEWYPDKKLVVIFQPHQYSRTRDFFDAFVESFEGAHEAWITDIYRARDSDEDVKSTSAEKLSAAILKNCISHYVSLDQLPQKIRNSADAEKVFLVMGAGNINSIFQKLF